MFSILYQTHTAQRIRLRKIILLEVLQTKTRLNFTIITRLVGNEKYFESFITGFRFGRIYAGHNIQFTNRIKHLTSTFGPTAFHVYRFPKSFIGCVYTM